MGHKRHCGASFDHLFMEALPVIGERWAHPPDARSQHVEGATASTEMKILLPGLAGAAVNPSRFRLRTGAARPRR